MKQYQELVRHIFNYGKQRGDRTDTGTRAVFGYQNRYNLKEGFPLVTTKDMKGNLELVVSELLWFLAGGTNIQPLVQQRNHIWDDSPFKE